MLHRGVTGGLDWIGRDAIHPIWREGSLGGLKYRSPYGADNQSIDSRERSRWGRINYQSPLQSLFRSIFKRHRLKYKHFVFRFEIASNSHLFAFLLFFHFFVVFFPCLPMFCPCFPFLPPFCIFTFFDVAIILFHHLLSLSLLLSLVSLVSQQSPIPPVFLRDFQKIVADSRDFVPRGFDGHIWLKISTRKY